MTTAGTEVDASEATSEPDFDLPPGRLVNRELSWLDFNERVLALASDPATPLLERVKFVAIFCQNLDEFFQVRVAGLDDQVEAGISTTSPDGLTPREQLRRIRGRAQDLADRVSQLFVAELVPALATEGIRFCGWDELGREDRAWLAQTFEERIFPVLTPLAVDPGHPFPYISSLSLNLGVRVRDSQNNERRFARIKVPQLLPRFVALPDGVRFIPLETVISAHLDRMFPGMEIELAMPFRITRNADLTLEEEEADDLLAAVEMEVRRRRFGEAVRLEVPEGADAEMTELLLSEVGVSAEELIRQAPPLDLSGLWAVYALDRSDLKYPRFLGVVPPRLDLDAGSPAADFFAVLSQGDLLVHHPYDSFADSVEEFVRRAAADPQVLAIKMTLYRTSGDSPIISSLIKAAERGKQVVALVELKARFDEANNIVWARRLEEAGVHVVYGLVGLKTHSKVVLVVRNDGSRVRRFVHVGTGNYNSKTARLYEDLGLLTADEQIGSDATELFNYLTGWAKDVDFGNLLVAPRDLRPALLALIEREIEAGPGAGAVVMKMNSLVDPVVIDALYRASRAGVAVRLIVRGICCLRAGVPGLSDNIAVRSILGRYLEHSRVYHFANGAGPGRPAWYFGSADVMPRNLDRRVEVLVRVDGAEQQGRLQQMVDLALSDDTLAWELSDTKWYRVRPTGGTGTVELHELLEQEARSRTARAPGSAG